MKKISLFMSMLAALALSMTFVACGSDDDDEEDASKGAIAVTGTATDITWNSATISGTVNLKELPSGFATAEFGVELSEDEAFSAPTRVATSDLDASGKSFKVEVSPLTPATTYYYRTYVTAQSINYYGNAKQFTTPVRSADSYEAVDLGFESGTLWAAHNVGANAPEEAGDNFAWGETEPKSVYKEDTYKYYDKEKEEYINIGSDIAGTDYDVAHVKWGSDWRMPTPEQFKELVENTTQEWTTLNGIEGRKYTSKVNDNSIFFPAAGYRWGSVVTSIGVDGYCWSSTFDESHPGYAYLLLFSEYGEKWDNLIYRSMGVSVRPVRKK